MKIFRSAKELKGLDGSKDIIDISLTEDEIRKAAEIWESNDAALELTKEVLRRKEANPNGYISIGWAERFGRAKKDLYLEELGKDEAYTLAKEKALSSFVDKALTKMGVDPDTLKRL